MSHEQSRPGSLVLAGRQLPIVGPARIYVCGVTPYDVTHLGHAATYAWVDVVTRLLRHVGIDTVVARNVTDVDDVLTRAARSAGVPYDRFAAMNQYQFDHDMAALGIARPDHEPRAHRHITGVIRLAEALLTRGVAYERGGTVYHRGAGLLASGGPDRATALHQLAAFGEDVDDAAKDDPLDIPVWRASGADDPAWPSPWGEGRPGWHAECAAMVLSIHGSSVDIHAGGADLAFPHHACESLHAEAVTGVTPFARSWLRVGTVQVAGEKMAKSTGNLVLVRDLLLDHAPSTIRMLLLDRPWSQEWDVRPDALSAAAARVEQVHAAAARPDRSETGVEEVVRLLLDDLDVPAATATALEAGGRAARVLSQILVIG